MKREYMTPEMEIQEIEKWDMIVTSGGDSGGGDECDGCARTYSGTPSTYSLPDT